MTYDLLIEKYTPKYLDDISGNNEQVNNIKNAISMNMLSHLILFGESGVGKTAVVRCISNEYEKKFNQKTDILEINASEARNLQIVKNKVKQFINKKNDTNLPKIIIIDEIDSMLDSTQSIISNYMDEQKIIFLLTCNKLKNILESIQTRAIIYKFNLLSDIEIKNILMNICSQEHILYDSSGIEAITFSSNGDIRVAINNLNITYCGYKNVNHTNVFKICNIPEPQLLVILVENIIKKNFHTSMILVKKFFKMGYNQVDIITNLFVIVNNFEMDEETKIFFLSNINKTLYYLSSVVNSDLQLFDLFATLCNYTN